MLSRTRTLSSAVIVASFAAGGALGAAFARPPALPPRALETTPAPFDEPTDGRRAIENACAICHGLTLIGEQRLTPAQWKAEVAKMEHFGAPLPATSEAAAIAHLARTLPADMPDRPLALEPEARGPVSVPPFAALVAPVPGGDPARGATAFAAQCAACHGPEARGFVGPRLVGRAILGDRAAFAAVVVNGRRLMPPHALDAGAVADLLAHLRTLTRDAPPGGP